MTAVRPTIDNPQVFYFAVLASALVLITVKHNALSKGRSRSLSPPTGDGRRIEHVLTALERSIGLQVRKLRLHGLVLNFTHFIFERIEVAYEVTNLAEGFTERLPG